ncbi:hypothetical protein LCGC14_0502870 [marine sediment metagenome]|uniref:Uncharacterized protein n=1 Tax=marine sediment metagenome TaxID=412755 RepID=A0A0F9S8I7_9ZZZZ
MPIGIITNPQYRTLKVGDISNGNYMQVLADGTIRLEGDARTWTDFSVPLTRDKQGQASKPDYDFTNLGLLFPQNNETEEIYLNLQMLHQKALSLSINMHVHYIQSAAEQPIFELQYKFYNNGGDVPGSWTTIDTSANKGRYTWTTNDMMQKGNFPTIAAPANEIVSANLDVKLYRQTGDGLAGDVLTKYVDFHFQIDSLGSAQEYLK